MPKQSQLSCRVSGSRSAEWVSVPMARQGGYPRHGVAQFAGKHAARPRWTPACEELLGCIIANCEQSNNRSAYCIDNAGNRYLFGFMKSC